MKIAAGKASSGTTAEASNQYAQAVATQIAPLIYRTQGLQFYRDGLHSLCIDRMNDWMPTKEDYLKQKQYLLDQAVALIKQELPIMGEAQKAFYQNVKAGEGIEVLQKMADIVKPIPATTTTTSTPTATTTTTVPASAPAGSQETPAPAQ